MTTTARVGIDALTAAVPDVEIVAAGPEDAVDGTPASFVATPSSTAEVAGVLKAAAEQGLAVVARGAGTKLTWGAPPHRVDLVVDLFGMDRVIEHSAGDLIVHVEAGLQVNSLQKVLAPSGQRLAVDPVSGPNRSAGTVGGLIATGASGPLRLSSGGVRDLLIGATIVRADGVVAKAGGKVVKNVAGYDLGKLFSGSWGTLGVITEAVFRLNPVPAASRWVTVPAADARAVGDVVQSVIHSQVVPSAVEVDRRSDGTAEVAVLIEGIVEGVDGRVQTLRDLLAGSAGAGSETAPDWWGRAPWSDAPGPDRDVALRLTTELAGLPRLIEALDEAAVGLSRRPVLRGSAGVGVLHAALPGEDPEAVAAAVTTLRKSASTWSGDVVVLDGPPGVKNSVDVWGPVRGLDLMRRVKDQFDPQHRLAPGRFVGGI
jgi:glycolate oxidase FAD binding subunit